MDFFSVQGTQEGPEVRFGCERHADIAQFFVVDSRADGTGKSLVCLTLVCHHVCRTK